MTDTTTTTTSSRSQFDHEAIAADLESGMSVRETAEKHGCSPSLANRIRRIKNGGVERSPRNVQRANALRKKATQLKADFDLLAKWAPNDTEDKVVEGIVTLLEEATEKLGEAADAYEALPPEVMKTVRSSSRVQLEAGMIVSVKEKFRETYSAVTSSPEHLTVVSTRDTHVLVEDVDKARMFFPRKELELRQDG